MNTDDKWTLAQLSSEEVLEMCKNIETQVLNQSIMTTLNMLSSGDDIDHVEARLQVVMEIAEGLGIDLEVPIGRRMIFQRIGKRFREKLDGLL